MYLMVNLNCVNKSCIHGGLSESCKIKQLMSHTSSLSFLNTLLSLLIKLSNITRSVPVVKQLLNGFEMLITLLKSEN